MNDGPAFASQLRCYLADAGLGVDSPLVRGRAWSWVTAERGEDTESLPGRQSGETTNPTWALS